MAAYQAMKPIVQLAVDGLGQYLNGNALTQTSLEQLPDLQKRTMIAWVAQKTRELDLKPGEMGYDDKPDYRILLGSVDNVIPVTRGRGPEAQTWYEVVFENFANVEFTPGNVSDGEANSLAELVRKIQDDTNAPLTLGNARIGYVGSDRAEYQRKVKLPGDRESGYVGIFHEDAKTHLLPLIKEYVDEATNFRDRT